MNQIFKILVILIFTLTCKYSFSQNFQSSSFGIGIGTTFGSNIGASFGQTWHLSYLSSGYEYDYDYYNYDYYYSDYYDDYNSYDIISPLILDLATDYRLNDFLSLSYEASFMWYLKGYPDRQYTSGTLANGENYLDKWGNGSLYLVPMFVNLKFYPEGNSSVSSLYISGGLGQQYTSESLDRIREVYDYNYYYYSSRYYILGSVSSEKWLPGFKVAMGVSIPLGPYFLNETEIKYTQFFPERNINSPLSMENTTNISFIGLSTKVFVNF